MFDGGQKTTKQRPWLWLLLGSVGLLSLGLLLPNRDLIVVRLFWLWSWALPLWLVITFGLALGALSAGAALTLLWRIEHRRRKEAEQQQQAVLDEVRALRRLLAQETPVEPLTSRKSTSAPGIAEVQRRASGERGVTMSEPR